MTYVFCVLAVAANIDSQTNIPLGWVLGSVVTIFTIGMWVSSKVTRFEEQQNANMRRMDTIEARLEHLENKRR